MQTAAVYIRVSTEDQIEYSPDSQLKKIQEYAQSHEILLPEHLIFLDEGISGRSARRRPAFLKMIGMAKQKPRPFDLILVWKFSRFARSRQDSILYKSMLRKDCGINVVSITEQLSDDPTAILIEALLEAMDEYYSINLAQEVRRGMNEKFSRGGVVSVPPFGYRMGTGHFEPDPEKAPFVPMIFRKFLNGISFRQIAVQLNELGVRTVRGNPFESRSIEYILTNPTYLGKHRRTADGSGSSMLLVDGNHPPLVEPDTFRMAQNRIAELKKTHPAGVKTAPARYMLHGLVRCSCCGSTLTLSEKGRSLQCHRYAKGLCSQSHHIRLNLLNRAFLSGLEKDLTADFAEPVAGRQIHSANPESFLPDSNTCSLHPTIGRRIHIRIHRLQSTGSETAALSRLLEQESRRLDRIRAAYESGIDSLEEYRQNRKSTEERIRKLKNKLKTQPSDPTRSAKSIQLTLPELLPLLRQDSISETAKNVMLKAFLSHITFNRSENTIQIHYRI